MKNSFFCFLLLCSFWACDSGKTSATDVPACVKTMYEVGPENGNPLQTVKRMKVGDGYHYWLNTGDLAFDGPEYIVNESCDTVCHFSMMPQDCSVQYENGEWEVVWQK